MLFLSGNYKKKWLSAVVKVYIETLYEIIFIFIFKNKRNAMKQNRTGMFLRGYLLSVVTIVDLNHKFKWPLKKTDFL